MPQLPFQLPDQNSPLAPIPAHNSDLRQLIAQRRSTPIKMMHQTAPGPEGDILENILAAAMRVPDHRKIEPWRMIVFAGDARARFGDLIAERFKTLNPDATDVEVEEERNRLLRGPVCVTIVSSPDHNHKTPVWEQELSAGALCLNLLYAAHAAGFAGSWISEWWAFDQELDIAMGLKPGERVAGHIFLGQAISDLVERPRPTPENKVTYWD